LDRLLVPKMLAAGSLVSSATAFRVSAGGLELLVERTPPLVKLAVRASVAGAGAAQSAFRDDFIGLARELAEASYREMRRGVDQLDAFTRPGDEPAAGRPRPYRVKT
jgi:hypothetical protein